jgi:ADP-dependent phosphofructokinase/glucokinase
VSYKLVLSTFGASGNNFVSLAYDVNIDATIKLLQSSIESERNKVTGTDIYARIM